MINTSGQDNNKAVPAEIDRWNWGAFLLSWIWGIGNNTFIALLTFVPVVGFIMPFVLGAKGNAWAWRNKEWESIEHFKAVQRKWVLWAGIAYLFFIASTIGIFIIANFDLIKEQGQWQTSSPISEEKTTGKQIDINQPNTAETTAPAQKTAPDTAVPDTAAASAPASKSDNSATQTETGAHPTEVRAGVRIPKGDPDNFWENFEWDELSAEEKKLWVILGWNGRNWGSDTETPASEGTSWDNLSKQQQNALTSLGYDKKIWNKED
ncbi:EI24 domain-containing protein [Candidatus Methylospira mobilis]|uniref:EI24 domain-containing protein n=1 Tax=Candidatus Methylospira mobilis TaxID=1808979 RepID=UPI001884DB2B|nr:EI24 domain-containing protein [Candidatus Methylospira mobilis]WNV04234.1 EI24 domain-containing protein [Candidatus Methylospira mobilis]